MLNFITQNEGELDRGVRLIAGLVILVLGAAFHTWFGLLGLIPLATALIGFCPLYRVFGLRTNAAS